MTKLRGNPWAVLVVVSLGFFMTLLDLTIVNIAIPDMIYRLHASLDGVLWVLNAYALVLAVLVITAGRLGDLIGPRTMFVAGIAVFTAASIAWSLASGLSSVIPVPSGWTGSLLEWAKAVSGWKLTPVPRTLKGRLAAWPNFRGAAKSRPVP